MIERITSLSALLAARYPKHHKIGRFLVSGSLATGTNLGVLYVLTDWFGIWYLISATIAFIVAFFISFTLQKFWTFEDGSREGMHFQAGFFLGYTLVCLGLNTLLLYFFVEYIHLHYMVSQILISVLIAVQNYFVYQRLIFRS